MEATYRLVDLATPRSTLVVVSNAVAVTALAVSFVSFGVSAFTLYQQFWKKAHVSVVLGEYAYLAYLREKKGIEITPAVTLLNDGASDATITRMTGHIEVIGGSWETSISWLYYVNTKAPQPDYWGTRLEVEGAASAIVVPDRQAITKWINFTSEFVDEAFTVPVGEYRLELSLDGPHGKKYSSRPYHFLISADDQMDLENRCVPDQTGATGTHAIQLLELTTPAAEHWHAPLLAPRVRTQTQSQPEEDSVDTSSENAPSGGSEGKSGA